MEVAGLVVGIVGLYTACQSCYSLYTESKSAQQNVNAALHDLQIHKSILKAWAFYWEIPESLIDRKNTGDQSERVCPKLEWYLKRYPDKAIGIASALQRTGDVLSDRERLLSAYGLEASLQYAHITGDEARAPSSARSWAQLITDVKEKTNTISSRIKLNRNFTWVLKDAAKFRSLIGELKKYNDALHLLSPESAFELLQISLALDVLPRWEESDLRQQHFSPSRAGSVSQRPGTGEEARAIGDSAGHELQSLSPSQEGVRVLSDLAEIKLAAAVGMRNQTLSHEQEQRLLSFRPDDLDTGPHEMAVWRSKRETVLFEKHLYTADSETLSQDIRTSILKLGQLLMLPSCAKHLHTLELLGLAEYPEREGIAFVYRLPSSLGQPRQGFPIYDMQLRKPRAMLLYQDGDPSHDLGWRFDLARKLVQSVAFLHASGWLHKNIRTSEIYFFPKAGPQISRDWDKMDFDTPFLLGFEYSRPDDVEDAEDVGDIGSPLPYNSLPVNMRGPVQFRPPPPVLTEEELYEADELLDEEPPPPPDEFEPVFDAHGLPITLDPHRGMMPPPIPSNIQAHGVSAHPTRVNLDTRHHPYKRVYPNRRYRHAFDVYSLGIVLLEIGMWQGLEAILPFVDDEEDPFRARRLLVEWVQKHLPPLCGKLYTEATVSCLTIDPEDSEVELATQRELCARIAIQLAQCRA